MKLAILGYNTLNIGDDMQSLIMSYLLPKIDYIIERDNYDNIYDYETGNKMEKLDEKVLLIMNCWLINGPNYSINNIKFPIKNKNIIPVYISTHISPNVKELRNDECMNDYRKNAPFYTRDMWTYNLLKNENIECYYFGCATQLVKKEYIKKNIDKNDLTILVDCDANYIEKYINENPTEKIKVITHIPENLNKLEPKERMNEVEKLLVLYSGANKIITTRLHCFLPCRALGINVTYIGPIDARTQDLVNNTPNTEELLKTFNQVLNDKIIKYTQSH